MKRFSWWAACFAHQAFDVHTQIRAVPLFVFHGRAPQRLSEAARHDSSTREQHMENYPTATDAADISKQKIKLQASVLLAARLANMSPCRDGIIME